MFRTLTPDLLMDTLEDFGFAPTGEYVQLNSYENRVFEISLESTRERLIVKVYRPNRWSKDQILEEHQFTQELFDNGIRSAPPLILGDSTLADIHGLQFAVFPKAHGRMLSDVTELRRIGRLLGQLHNVGQSKPTQYRSQFNHGEENLNLLSDWVAPEVERRYFEAAEVLLDGLYERLDETTFFRIHGDFHRGNLLLYDVLDEPKDLVVVDFDDFVMGPEVQDIWMLLSGDQETSQSEIEQILEGYEEFRHFPKHQLELIPFLRALRIISYAAWIARRWKDPVFPQLFPQFQDYTYWAEETEALERLAWSVST